jgi:hypothetical protein
LKDHVPFVTFRQGQNDRAAPKVQQRTAQRLSAFEPPMVMCRPSLHDFVVLVENLAA